MNKNQNFNSFFASLDRGIKKAALWVARMFGYKSESKFGRIVWHVLSPCIAILALSSVITLVIWGIEGLADSCRSFLYDRKVNSSTYLHEYDNEFVSPYVVYHDGYPGYIYNTKQGRRTLKKVNWICESFDRDSLAVFCSDEKRGYFNRFTGEVVIPAQYEKAWVFSEGLACVMERGMLHFIDHKGQTVWEKVFPYVHDIDEHCFHNGLCVMMGDNGSIGFIDRQGNWKVDPEYDGADYVSNGFWKVWDEDEGYGLLNVEGEIVLPVMYDYVSIHEGDSSIYVTRHDHVDQVLDFDMNIINSCNFSEVEKMEYDTDEYDEEGILKSATAKCLRYRNTDWYYGLMDRSGNMVTLPLYSDIEAIGPDRYQCDGPYGAVILDDKGNECGEKL